MAISFKIAKLHYARFRLDQNVEVTTPLRAATADLPQEDEEEGQGQGRPTMKDEGGQDQDPTRDQEGQDRRPTNEATKFQASASEGSTTKSKRPKG